MEEQIISYEADLLLIPYRDKFVRVAMLEISSFKKSAEGYSDQSGVAANTRRFSFTKVLIVSKATKRETIEQIRNFKPIELHNQDVIVTPLDSLFYH